MEVREIQPGVFEIDQFDVTDSEIDLSEILVEVETEETSQTPEIGRKATRPLSRD